jgi:hypothetical protein
LHFIQTKVIPELQFLNDKYAEWWIFKPFSTLHKYLRAEGYQFNSFFCPYEIVQAITNIAEANCMIDPGNSNVIIPDQKLFECFNTWNVYKRDLYKHCFPHMTIVKDKKTDLKHENIYSDFYLDSPLDIIYNDPSSLFWIHPTLNYILCNNQKLSYSWKELYDLFSEFISKPNLHIEQKEESIFYINEKSILKNIFKFNQFHVTQISDILKQSTKFLGKTNTLLSLCNTLHFDHIEHEFSNFKTLILFLEVIIVNNNNLLPYVESYIAL